MYCPNCGAELEDDALFCTSCGTKLDAWDTTNEETSCLNDEFKQRQPLEGGPQAQPEMAGSGAGMPGGAPQNVGTAGAQSAERGAPQPNGQGHGGPSGANVRPAKGKGRDQGYRAPAADIVKGGTGAQPKKKKTGLIVMIIVIAVLCVAIIAGAVIFVVMQRQKNQKISDFQGVVDSFEEMLENSNYSSIEDEVNELMQRCEQAIEDKSVKNIEDLEEKIADIRARLGDISAKIGSLEELKESYQSLIDEKYYVPEELQQYVDDMFANLQTAIDNGAADQLDNMKAQMEEMLQGIADKDMELINSLKSAIEGLDVSAANEDERASLENYANELQQLIDSQQFKQAIEKAQAYQEFANQVVENIVTRQKESEEESRRESEEQAAKNDYICPESNSRYLTESDLAGLSDWELLIARNEIYARHGRKFNDPDIRAYFESKSWYNGTVDPDSFSTSVFNTYELKNIEFIQAHEK